MDFRQMVSAEDWEAHRKGRHGDPGGYGRSPALLVVDMTYAFCDPAYSLAAGPWGAMALKHLPGLLQACRERDVPIVYTRLTELIRTHPAAGTISRKRVRGIQEALEAPRANDIVDEIAPATGDFVLEKSGASAFHGTDLLKILIYYRIDTLIVTGAATSGCVRATVVDAGSYNYYVVVPEECVADRAEPPHQASLFDMQMKYADVVPVSAVLEYLAGLPPRLADR